MMRIWEIRCMAIANLKNQDPVTHFLSRDEILWPHNIFLCVQKTFPMSKKQLRNFCFLPIVKMRDTFRGHLLTSQKFINCLPRNVLGSSPIKTFWSFQIVVGKVGSNFTICSKILVNCQNVCTRNRSRSPFFEKWRGMQKSIWGAKSQKPQKTSFLRKTPKTGKNHENGGGSFWGSKIGVFAGGVKNADFRGCKTQIFE